MSTSDIHLESKAASASTGPAPDKLDRRALFFMRSEPEISSGSPVIMADLLDHFSADDAELICERRPDITRRRELKLRHRVWRIGYHFRLWPLRRGSRVRAWLLRLGLPFVALLG